MAHSKATQPFAARKIGAPNTLDYRIFIEKDGVPLSPFHDIPLYANDQQTVLNMIVEVPRWTNAKMEVTLPNYYYFFFFFFFPQHCNVILSSILRSVDFLHISHFASLENQLTGFFPNYF